MSRRQDDKTQHEELPWQSFWGADLIDSLKLVEGSATMSIDKVILACDNVPNVHDWFQSVRETPEELQSRAQIALHVYHLTRRDPFKLNNVFVCYADNEPDSWWVRLQNMCVHTVWFDVRANVGSRRFRRSSAPGAMKLWKDARDGKLDPQAFFFTVLPDENKAVATAATVIQDQRVIMSSILNQNNHDAWPTELSVFTLAVLHRLLGQS